MHQHNIPIEIAHIKLIKVLLTRRLHVVHMLYYSWVQEHSVYNNKINRYEIAHDN